MVQVYDGNRVLCEKVKVCDTLFSRFLGLMFSFDKTGAWFKPDRFAKHSIHMFFVFRTLDVYWLDKENRVVHYELAKPFFPFYCPKEKAYSILELPYTAKKVQVGSKLKFD